MLSRRETSESAPTVRLHLSTAHTRMIAAAAIAILLVLPASAQGINWHTSLDDGLRPAEASHKPMIVFVYLGADDDYVGQREDISLTGDRADRQRQVLDIRRMIDRTLTDAGVVAAARSFEPVMLDLRLKANDDARERLKVSPVVSEGTDHRVGVYPITLFLDSHGDELFRRHGYLPPEAYELQLLRAANLFDGLRETIANPDDATARRNLGRAYMEMDFARGDRFYEAAVRNLEMAVELDPRNESGASYDARVDLAILRLPDNPTEALRALAELQAEDEEDSRRLEIQYYMAVAHYVLEDHAAAARILSDFETDDRRSPYFDSPWTPQALGLLQYIRRHLN